MFAQVVFDLPLDSHFDYSVPSPMQERLRVGSCVHVLFGPKKALGIVTSFSTQSVFEGLKPIKAIDEKYPLLDKAQMALGSHISAYYGCSLGQALFTILRGCAKQEISQANSQQSGRSLTLHVMPMADYESFLIETIKPLAQKKQRVLVLVPDQFEAGVLKASLEKQLPLPSFVMGTRSLVFRNLSDIALVIMIDEKDPSYKQEQTPMYETRQVLLMRLGLEGLPVIFLSSVPSVEIMALVSQGDIVLKQRPFSWNAPIQVVDLNNYKNLLHGILSPALTSALEGNIRKKLQSILVLNHHERIEQLQKTLQEKFPQAKIKTFEKTKKALPAGCDILIGTTALLRFKNQMKAGLVILVDIDRELNQLNSRSCFSAFAMAQDFRNMAQGQLMVQSRNPQHYVIESLVKEDSRIFYSQDMHIRKELGVSPFGHQVLIQIRHKREKSVQEAAKSIYQALCASMPQGMAAAAPAVEVAVPKSDFYRMNILLQGKDVAGMIVFIKQAISRLKPRLKVIVTFNVDP